MDFGEGHWDYWWAVEVRLGPDISTLSWQICFVVLKTYFWNGFLKLSAWLCQGQNQRISPCSTLTSSTASPPAGSPCSTLPPTMPGQTGNKDCAYGSVTSPTSTLESRDSGIIGEKFNTGWWYPTFVPVCVIYDIESDLMLVSYIFMFWSF